MMYENIGNKIQSLATIVAGIGIIASIIVGCIIADMGMRMDYGGEGLIAIGIVVIVLGSLLSWINMILLYGYGELIETNSEIERGIKILVKNSTSDRDNDAKYKKINADGNNDDTDVNKTYKSYDIQRDSYGNWKCPVCSKFHKSDDVQCDCSFKLNIHDNL